MQYQTDHLLFFFAIIMNHPSANVFLFEARFETMLRQGEPINSASRPTFDPLHFLKYLFVTTS